MKQSSVILTVLILCAAMLTACSGGEDTLASNKQETQHMWGLTLDENGMDKESETEKESEPETEDALKVSVKELDNGVKLFELKDTEIRIISTVNVRSGPGTDFDKLGKMAESDTAVMKGICDNGWIQIDFDGGDGFVSMDYVEAVDEDVSLTSLLDQLKDSDDESSSDESSEEISETGNNNESGVESAADHSDEEGELAWATTDVNVRKGPKSSYEVVGQLNQGESVKVLDSSDAWWWKVEFEGQEAYISVQYLTTEKPEE